MRNRRNSNFRRGFTMIELLIVIGVIGILTAIAVLGFRAVQRSGANKKTTGMLANIASMFAEYDVATGLRRQPPHMWLPANTQHTGAMNFWKDSDPTAGTAPNDQEGLASPGSLAEGTTARTDSPAIRNTQIVMSLMNAVPNNKTLISQLPADGTMRLADLPPAAGYDESAAPLLLDAWDNPIIFVPASGLRGVMLGDPAVAAVVTSAKTYVPATGLTDGTMAPNARPFFASAGPDGDFSKGDDNLYSFEN